MLLGWGRPGNRILICIEVEDQKRHSCYRLLHSPMKFFLSVSGPSWLLGSWSTDWRRRLLTDLTRHWVAWDPGRKLARRRQGPNEWSIKRSRWNHWEL